MENHLCAGSPYNRSSDEAFYEVPTKSRPENDRLQSFTNSSTEILKRITPLLYGAWNLSASGNCQFGCVPRLFFKLAGLLI